MGVRTSTLWIWLPCTHSRRDTLVGVWRQPPEALQVRQLPNSLRGGESRALLGLQLAHESVLSDLLNTHGTEVGRGLMCLAGSCSMICSTRYHEALPEE